MSEEQINEWATTLVKVTPFLGWSDQSFAASLISQWEKNGRLSPSQGKWTKTLALRGMDRLPRGPIGDAVLMDIKQ